MPLKILFINTYDYKQKMKFAHKYPPLGLGYIVSFLRKNLGTANIECKIVDDNVEMEADSFKPDIVGISSVSQNFDIAKEYAKILKSKGCKIILGGIHISSLPETLPLDADVGVIGEGEETSLELARLFIEHSDFPPEKLKDIKGIVFRNGGRLIQTDQRAPISNLDNIPPPARDLMNVESATYMFSSRGCPYKCVFCASTRFFNRVRFFSARYVVSEIESLLKDHVVKEIFFMDDLFIGDQGRVFEIRDLVKSKGLDKKIEFGVSVRANLINNEINSALKDMGVRFVTCGLESANPESLRYLKGKTANVEHNRRAIELCSKAGFRVVGSFVIGHPTETRHQIMDTYNFIKGSKLYYADVYVLTPFPGTPIWDYARVKGLVSNDMDWRRLRMDFRENYKNAIIVSEVFSRKQLRKIHLEFYRMLGRRNLILRVKEKFKRLMPILSTI